MLRSEFMDDEGNPVGSLGVLWHALPWAAWTLATFVVIALLLATKMESLTGSSRKVNILLVASVGLIVGTTLTPQRADWWGHLDGPARSRHMLTPLLRPPWEWFDPTDRLLNICLFIPLGLCLPFVARPTARRLATIGAITLPFVVEGLQGAVPGLQRDPQWQDVVDNLLGLLLGLSLGLAARLGMWQWQTRYVATSSSHRRPRSWRPSLKVLAVSLALLAAIAALAVWLGSSWLATYRQAQAVQLTLSQLRADLSAKEWAKVSAGLSESHDQTAALLVETRGTQWQLLMAAPFVGATASAVNEMAVALEGVLAAAEPLAPYADRIISHDIRTPDGAVDVAAMKSVAPLVRDFSTAVASAETRLSLVNPRSVMSAVEGPLTEFRTALADASPGVERAADAVSLLPAMLGADGPRNWLVLLQNPAEARGSGGFVGGYVVLTADSGRVTMTSRGTSTDLATSTIPSRAASEDSQVLWGNMLNAWNTFNMAPSFPGTAKLAAAGMESRGVPVAGVIAVDPGAVASLLTVTGPVSGAGETITSENVEQFFTVDIYAKYADNAERDSVSTELMAAVFDAFLGADVDPIAVVEGVRKPASEGRLLVWSEIPEEQARLANSSFGGVLPSEPGSTIAVAFNNAAGNKMDAFVASSVEYSPGRCVTKPLQDSNVVVKLRNDAPNDLPATGSYGRLDDPSAPEGSTNMLVHIYAPVGANFLSATIDGKSVPLYLGEELNRPVWWTYVPIERGQDRTLDVQFQEPMVLGVQPKVVPQSMRLDESITVTPNTEC